MTSRTTMVTTQGRSWRDSAASVLSLFERTYSRSMPMPAPRYRNATMYNGVIMGRSNFDSGAFKPKSRAANNASAMAAWLLWLGVFR